MTALEVVDISVTLGGAAILHGVSMSVEAGEWVTVIGPNGAGKSTLLRAIGGVIAYRGQVRLLGRPAGELGRRERAQLVATVPQSPAVPPGMAVLDYVLLGRTPYIRPLARESRHDLEVVDGVLDRLDLVALADRPLETLSGGERQRVFLGRALAQGATILMLDEPTSSLDIGHQQEVLDLVDELRRDHGLTVVATMHDLSVAGEYAERMVLLSKGRVVAVGSPAQVLTEESLARYYGARVRVLEGERGPLIIPVRSAPASG
jgi:iron complex transport system ATP-binding protein